MSSPADTIAFIGLGVMGYPMAVNLVKGLGSSKSFLIADVNQEALNEFQNEVKGFGKVSVVQNGSEAAKAADTVITMLPTATVVEAVYLDPDTGILVGAVAAAADGNPAKKLLIECGTIETATIKKVAKATEEASFKLSDTLSFADAPVSGGPMGAIDGSLTFMVGVPQAKSANVFTQVEALLKHMGKSIFQCGDVGAGTAFKIINNYLSAITSLAAAEALNIGVKAGLDPKLLSDVINVSGGQCWVTSKANPVPGVLPNVPSSNGYVGGFRIELCEKVLQMGSMLAEDVGAKTVLDGPTKVAFQEAMRDERYKVFDFIYHEIPQLSLHITLFNDAALVALSWPHTLMDVMGQQALLRGWSMVLAGRESEVPPVLGAREDTICAAGDAPVERKEDFKLG
ncbi:3-hydroxyisobutyrate dehydrogenase [Fusarium pseudoanthophilum]|uniref:3-hydroxyisobutyrate dehydrogenase n=1 Tax=Fusarium pseudoanthophilum TaxID=48495 RepID=A0A8H5L8A8_9HYPO|nr:3-hydroxyisobutyrate dehydrogenase [Fusarium pseudoanthophilum]